MTASIFITVNYIYVHRSVSELVYLPTEYTGWGRGIVRCSLLPHRLYLDRELIVVVKQIDAEFSLLVISVFKPPRPKKREKMSVCTCIHLNVFGSLCVLNDSTKTILLINTKYFTFGKN